MKKHLLAFAALAVAAFAFAGCRSNEMDEPAGAASGEMEASQDGSFQESSGAASLSPGGGSSQAGSQTNGTSRGTVPP